MTRPILHGLVAAAVLSSALACSALRAGATGTATIQHPDGSRSTYANVRIIIWDDTMQIKSTDGQGKLVIGKASCTKIDSLIRCLPWDATLFQSGERMHIALKSGTVWLNPSSAAQILKNSSTRLPPHGVILSVHTQRGTYVTLTGVVDEVHR